MKNKIYSIFEKAIEMIVHNYRLAYAVKTSIPPLRIVDEFPSKKTGEMYFLLQIAGKNIFPKISLAEIKANLSLLSSFSIQDRIRIVDLIHLNEMTDSKMIIAKTYDRFKKEFIFTIACKDQAENSYLDMTASEIFNTIPMNEFGKEDVFQIAYELGKS